MMSLNDVKSIYGLACFALCVILSSPTIVMVVSLPTTSHKFSELWILGENGLTEDYPFNVGIGREYRVQVGVGNHMGSLQYYKVYVKFRNETQQSPNPFGSTPSPLNSTYVFQFFVASGESWERPLAFSVQGEPSLIESISLNRLSFPVNVPSRWNSNTNTFSYNLFFELWIYNMTQNAFQYHHRFVEIRLNATAY